jgi:hypothetical protein
LERFIRSCEREWLWRESEACESRGRFEEAFRRTREMLELDPGDAEASARLMALGDRINAPEGAAASPAGDAIPSKTWRMAVVAGGIAVLGILVGIWISGAKPPPREDMGRALAEKENSLIKKEVASGWNPQKADSLDAPPAKPYGTLILEGMPSGFSAWVNGKPQKAGKPLHLPEAIHAVEVRDASGRPVLRDSVRVSAGEPARFDFAREFSRAAPGR